ncbi:non-specific serine,threonine protein kinase [Sarracenia purpurea var. burkii]
MASDSLEPTRRKHQCSSPGDGAEEPSKRRKHRNRHHRHHHHHHHRHSSRKHGGHEAKRKEVVLVEDESKRLEEEEVALRCQPPLLSRSISSNSRPNYDDMEEGEIVEDEDFGSGDADFAKKITDCVVKSVEIKAAEVRCESDYGKTVVHGSQGAYSLKCKLPGDENLDRTIRNSKLAREDKSGEHLVMDATLDENVIFTGGSKIHNNTGLLGNSSSGNFIDGNIGQEHLKKDHMPLTQSESPVKGNHKRKSYHDDDIDSLYQRKSLSSENNLDRYKNVAQSPSNNIDCEEVQSWNRSKSHDQERERSRSQSILVEASLMKTTQTKDASNYPDNRTSICDSDDDKMVGRNWDYQHDYRDLSRDDEREYSSSYRRFTMQVYRHHSHDGCSEGTRETWDREMEQSRETWNRDREGRGIDRDKQRERERARDRDRDRDRGRERERERARDRDIDKDREREKDEAREKNRERMRERERRNIESGRDRVRDKEREKESDMHSEKDRERHRESGRDKIRDKEREKESDMFSRQRMYQKNVDTVYDGRDRNDSKRRRNDERDHGDRAKKNVQEKNHFAKIDSLAEHEKKFKRDNDKQEDYQERIALQLVDEEEDDINRIKEESRRRRQAIIEKYKIQQSHRQQEPHLEDEDKERVEGTSFMAANINVTPETPDSRSEGVNCVVESSFNVGKSPQQNGVFTFERTSGAGGLGEGTPKGERSDDTFCDDIFGESPAGVRKTGKGDGFAIERSGLHDNWDDAEGYYSYRLGELLDGRYEVTAAHGKGVFSTVIRAKDLKAGSGDPGEVAIKIIRNNEHMHKAGKEELIILKKLVGADPDNKRHCVRFLSSFKYRNHLCLVFESLHMNLREVLKKFGRNIGLKLTAVRTYAKQLFIALKHLRNCGVLHCDIKPDNMLVNEAKNVLKLCDFGNAMFAGKNEITPYLVSRFYRAPEIILGLAYDHPVDIWSVGCCLFELYTGKVLFPGATNNDMLRLHMELKGPFPKKMLRKGAFTEQHFDQDLNFLATEEDPVTKKTLKRLILNIKPKDIGAIVLSSLGEDPKMLANFRDLLEKIFVLDPDKRDVWSGGLLAVLSVESFLFLSRSTSAMKLPFSDLDA